MINLQISLILTVNDVCRFLNFHESFYVFRSKIIQKSLRAAPPYLPVLHRLFFNKIVPKTEQISDLNFTETFINKQTKFAENNEDFHEKTFFKTNSFC